MCVCCVCQLTAVTRGNTTSPSVFSIDLSFDRHEKWRTLLTRVSRMFVYFASMLFASHIVISDFDGYDAKILVRFARDGGLITQPEGPRISID
jgi:hypothetical protein